jgi:hypothetical protein
MKLSNIILEDFTKFKVEANELENELKDTYNRDDIDVTIGQYHNKDRGYGKVSFRTREELAPSEWNNIKNFIEAKGYEITSQSNFADDDGDRYFYPTIKFEYDI